MGKNKTTSLKLHVPDASREMIDQCEKLVHNYTGSMTTMTVCEDGRDSGGTFLAGISMVTSKSSVDMTISLEERPAIYLLEKILDMPADGEGVDVKLNEDKQLAADLIAFLYAVRSIPGGDVYQKLIERICTNEDEENTMNIVSLSTLRKLFECAKEICDENHFVADAEVLSEVILKRAEDKGKATAEKPAEPTADQPAADQQEPEKDAAAPTPESGAEPAKPRKRGRPRKNPAPETPAPGPEAKPATESTAEAVTPDTTPATDQQQDVENE